jgi:hypothetical protein
VIRAWNAIRHRDGAERAVRSEQFRNNLHLHDWPIRQADLACSSLVINSQRGIHLTGLAQLRGLPWEGPAWAS